MSEESFTLSAVTYRSQRWLAEHSVLAFLYAFAENYEKIGEPEMARALREAAEKLRKGERV